MKTYASLIFVHLYFVAPLWSQTPPPKPSADVVTGYITVDGGPHPGRVAYKDGMKLLEALEAVRGGGLTDVDSMTKSYRVHLIRGDKVETFSLNRLRAKQEEQPVLRPGDVISFPQTVASEKTEEAARKVVERYYSELERGHYEVAYQLWRGDGSSSGKKLQDFTAGFADTAHTSVVTDAPTDGEGAAGSLYVTIPVRVTAVLKDGTRQQYVGKYVMHRCNDVDGCTLEDRRWHINSASLRVAP